MEDPIRMALVDVPATPSHVVLELDWKGFLQVLDRLEEERLRFTYDRGRLEIMTVSFPHSRRSFVLGDLISAALQELSMECVPGGDLLFKREDVLRGFRPDQCFWIHNEAHMREREDFDPTVDPPPDLVIEIEVSRTVLSRLSVMAALGVPEVWRLTRRGDLRVLRLAETGRYERVEASPIFPTIPPAQFARHMAMQCRGWLRAVRLFRSWIRRHAAPPPVEQER